MLKLLVVAVVVSSCGRSFAWKYGTCCRISTTPNAGTVSYINSERAGLGLGRCGGHREARVPILQL